MNDTRVTRRRADTARNYCSASADLQGVFPTELPTMRGIAACCTSPAGAQMGSNCGGTGTGSGGTVTCPQCNGTGNVDQMAGAMRFSLSCPRL